MEQASNPPALPSHHQYHPPAPVYKHVSTEVHYTNNNDFLPAPQGMPSNFHPYSDLKIIESDQYDSFKEPNYYITQDSDSNNDFKHII